LAMWSQGRAWAGRLSTAVVSKAAEPDDRAAPLATSSDWFYRLPAVASTGRYTHIGVRSKSIQAGVCSKSSTPTGCHSSATSVAGLAVAAESDAFGASASPPSELPPRRTSEGADSPAHVTELLRPAGVDTQLTAGDARSTPTVAPAVLRDQPPRSTTELLAELRAAVNQVFDEVGEAASGRHVVALGESSLGMQCVCGALEQLLNHGLTSTQFGIFRRCSFWQCVDSVLELSAYVKRPTPLILTAVEPQVVVAEFWQTITDTRRIREVRTGAGRGRAWLRLALQRQLLPAFLLLLAADQKLLELWYEEGALLRSEDCVCAAATVVSALQAFDLSALQPSSSLLDVDNPFATRTEYRLTKAQRGAQLSVGLYTTAGHTCYKACKEVSS